MKGETACCIIIFLLNNDADNSAGAVIYNPLHGFLKLQLIVIGQFTYL
jgi:hypothetical protein